MATESTRITIFKNGDISGNGRVLKISSSDTIDSLLITISEKLGFSVKKLLSCNGAMIDNVDLIYEGDVIYASGGESFESYNYPIVPRSAMGLPRVPSVNINRLKAPDSNTDWITLNVGGKYFTTTRATLCNEEDSMLARMFANDKESHQWSSNVDSNGAFLIDRSPIYFEPILNYLRNGELFVDKNVNLKGLLADARFYGISSLFETLEIRILEETPLTDASPVTRREFILRLLGTKAGGELRCQGINFAGTDLSKLDLRNINFKFANLKGANLSASNLENCNLERADLSRAKLNGAKLLNAKLICVNLEYASMRGCNFDDPAGNGANLEGANMKYVDLEGSMMARVNLRVATLRQAIMKNCDLRGAILAGADLENADLTSSDLHEANLRGANLKGALLELMVNPLHMSQTI